MKKDNKNKKSLSLGRKIGIGTSGVLIIAIVAVGLYWFSMPVQARNMIYQMMFASESYENHEEYQVVERNDKPLEPTGPEMIAAESEQGGNNVNIGTASEMVLNEESFMFKIGSVQTVGSSNYTGWQLLADEGAEEGEYPFGPSPLSYYTGGVASNLHTEILMAAEAYDVVLKNVKVEVVNDFHWDEMFEEDGVGHLDLTTVDIIIESDASEEVIVAIKETAINSWAVGQALLNETPVTPNLSVNGDDWDVYKSSPGTSDSDVSYDGDVKMSSVTEEIVVPQYIELWESEEEDSSSLTMSMDTMNNLTFQIYAVAENMNNPERPYYQSVTVSSPSGETWELYADEFMDENDVPLAPTPLEYFTVGTTLCLTSQTTLVGLTENLDIDDYRVEHFFEYSQEDVGTQEARGGLDQVQTFVYVQGGESQATYETFLSKSLALCFAGEGLVNVTDMDINLYVNGEQYE